MLRLCFYKASLLLVLLQNCSCVFNSIAAACVQAQMAANEQGHASQIKSWQTRLEAEEELTERMASRLRTDLEEKNQQLKVTLGTHSLNDRANSVMHEVCLCALYLILKMMCMECTCVPAS